jgi:hypothetical protein
MLVVGPKLPKDGSNAIVAVPVGAGPKKWVSNFNFVPLVWYNLLKRCACNAKVIPSKGLNLGFLSKEHMKCTKLDYVG